MCRSLVAIGSLFLLLVATTQASVIRVGDGGGDDYETIQEGIAASDSGDTVLVAAGTYTGPSNRDIDFGGKAITLTSESGSPLTTIDCAGLGRAFDFHNGETPLSLVQGFTIENGSSFEGGAVRCMDASPTFAHCEFLFNESIGGAGGAFLCSSSDLLFLHCSFQANSASDSTGGVGYIAGGSPTFEACSFADNSALTGGGAFQCVSGSLPRWSNCEFMANTADAGNGGALLFLDGSSALIDTCSFTGNMALYGGAVYLQNSHATFSGVLLTDNEVSESGGAVCCIGASPTLVSCHLSGNAAGGASSEHGGGMYCVLSSYPVITDCVFEDNYGHYGGGLYCSSSSSPTLTGCTFDSNRATYYGSGLYCSESSPILMNCAFLGNRGPAMTCEDSSSPSLTDCSFEDNVNYGSGGGMSCRYSSAPTLLRCTFARNAADGFFGSGGGGGGMYCVLSSPVLTDCTFEQNSAVGGYNGGGDGGGIYCGGSSLELTECTFIGNHAEGVEGGDGGEGGGLYCSPGSYVVLTNCTLEGNYGHYGDESAGGGICCVEAASIELTGCTLDGNGARLGGGFYCSSSDSTALSGCEFVNNTGTGAGIYTYDTSPVLVSCSFEENSAGYSDHGGGVYSDHSSPWFSSCVFAANQANNGAGVYCRFSSLTLSDCSFTANQSVSDGYGAGMYCGYGSSVTFLGGVFSDNYAVMSGGGLYIAADSLVLQDVVLERNTGLHGGGIYLNTGTAEISGCSFDDNSANGGSGGAIAMGADSVTIEDCLLRGNSAADGMGGGIHFLAGDGVELASLEFAGNAAQHGGGMSCAAGVPHVSDCVFYGNAADSCGGGLYCEANAELSLVTLCRNTAPRGGAVFCSSSSPVLSNVTIASNGATVGGSGLWCHDSAAQVENTIIAFGTGSPPAECTGAAQPSFTHCCIFGHASGDSLCSGFRDNMFGADPQFCDVTADSLGLAAESPCLPLNNDWYELVGARGLECLESPVSETVHGVITDAGAVLLRWVLDPLGGALGFNVYRSTVPDGSFLRVNSDILPPTSPGQYEDSSVWPDTDFWYCVRVCLADGSEVPVGTRPVYVVTTGRLVLELHPPAPNPFEQNVDLIFDVPGDRTAVTLRIHDVTGRLVRTIMSKSLGRGRHRLSWDGRDAQGVPVASGVYLARLVSGARSAEQKLLRLRR